MASFDGATFLELQQGDGFPSWDARMLVLDRQPANESATTAHIGLDVQKANIAGLVTASELAALYTKLGESGSLVTHWETHDAYLDGIDPPMQFEPGGDQIAIVMHFIRL